MNFYFERSNIFGLVGCLFLRHKSIFVWEEENRGSEILIP